jgi:hypothetical protein
MSQTGAETAKRRFGWNPFQRLDGEGEARSAAKVGAVVSGYLILSYLIQIAFVYSNGKDTFGDEGIAVLISDTIAVAFAAILTWRILAAQPLWAAIVVFIWYVVELAMKVLAIASGAQTTNAGWIIMFLALSAGAILSVRGSWRLRVLRRSKANERH